MAKKVISFVVAFAVLVASLSCMASAFTRATFGVDAIAKIMIESDKTSYKQGDVVTFTVLAQVAEEVGDLRQGWNYVFGYDGTYLEPLSDDYEATTSITSHGVQYNTDLFADEDFTAAGNQVYSNDMILANSCDVDDTYPEWNQQIAIQHTPSAKDVFFSALTPTMIFTFQMRVKADAPDGATMIGVNGKAYEEWFGFLADAAKGGIYANDGADSGYSTTYNYEFGTCTFTVGEESAPAILTPMSSQIRFDSNADGSWSEKISVRTRATATLADLGLADKTNAEIATAIENAGFVYTAAAGDVTAAKAAVDKALSTGAAAKANVDGYTFVPVDYAQNTGDAIVFTCLVNNIAKADIADGEVQALAYITVGGVTHYFDAMAVANFKTLYNDNYVAANAANPALGLTAIA